MTGTRVIWYAFLLSFAVTVSFGGALVIYGLVGIFTQGRVS